MQKKLITLALAGLVALPSVVQADNSNVTVYGIMDMGISNYSGSNTHKTRTGMDSGLQSSSRIGFEGVEDLGNGNKVLFHAEFGYAGDAKNRGSDTFEKRDLYLGLSGDYGTVLMGRLSTPQDSLLDSVDPFHTGTVGDIEKGYVVTSLISLIGEGDTYADYQDTYLDNTLAYVTPDWNGFTTTIAITNNAIGDEPTESRRNGLDYYNYGKDENGKPVKFKENGDNDLKHNADKYMGKRTNAKAIAFSPVYNNGPLLVGLNVHYIEQDRNDNFESSIGTIRLKDVKNLTWDLAGAYDFGWARFSAVYGQQKLKAKSDLAFGGKAKSQSGDYNFNNLKDMKLKQFMIGAEIPLSDSDRIMVSAAHYEAEKMSAFLEADRWKDKTEEGLKSNRKTKNTKWAIGYQHDLSKRTNIYAAFAKFSKKNRLANVGAEMNSGYNKGFNLGLRHAF